MLAARRPGRAGVPGGWEFPGGKVEPGESAPAALVREVEEELGCTVEVLSWLPQESPVGDEMVLRVATVRLLGGEPRATEHDALRWVGPESLDDLAWLPADRPFLPAVRRALRQGLSQGLGQAGSPGGTGSGRRGVVLGVRNNDDMTSSGGAPGSGKRLLLVHAHPDDETIGQGATMARYAAEGVRVTLVTCTGGEMGEILVPELEHLAAERDDTLAEHRQTELANAMKALGVDDHRYLGGFGRFRDSGMQWAPEGHPHAGAAIPADETSETAFWNADLTEAADLLVEVIREVRPQVLVTYDQFGGYGHPDHIQAHRVATYAASLAAVPTYRAELGEPWEIAKIYWGAMSANRMREGIRRLRESGDTTSFRGMDEDHLPPFVAEDDALAAVVEAGDYIAAKLDAMRAHATQIAVDGPFFALSNNIGDQVWGSEFYRIAKGEQGHLADDGLEHDLFAGVDLG